MEQTTTMPQNVYELVQQTYEEDAKYPDTYANSLIRVLKKHHLWPSMLVKKFKGDSLVLLHNTYNREDVGRFQELYDQCRSIVLDFSTGQDSPSSVVVSYSNNIPKRISIEEYSQMAAVTDIFQEAYDGTMITVYNFNGVWHFGTSSCTDAYYSKFANSNKSHGHMFDEALLNIFRGQFTEDEINSNDPLVIASISNRLREAFVSYLDPSIAYEFVLVHYENPHIIDYTNELGTEYKVIYHVNSKNRQTLQELDNPLVISLPGIYYPLRFQTVGDAYQYLNSKNTYGFIAKRPTPNGTKLFKISPKHVEYKEETDPCNPNVWHNILMVYMKNKKDYKINDYIKMYASDIQIPLDNRGRQLDPTYLIHTMIQTLKDVLYNVYVATTVYNPSNRRLRINKELDKQFPPVIRFHMAQLRNRQLHDSPNAFLRPNDVYYYLCHCNNVKNIKLLITFFATSVGYNINEKSALCLTILNGLL